MARATRSASRGRSSGAKTRSAVFRPRPVRTKLDPRLAYLASLSLGELRKLKEAEDKALSAVVQRFAQLRSPSGETDVTRAAEELRTLEALLFAPLTTGVQLPRPGGGRPRARDIDTRFNEPVFSVFVLGDASATDLRKLGAVVRFQSCDIFTAFLPRTALQALEQSPAIRFIELARPWFYDLDVAIP